MIKFDLSDRDGMFYWQTNRKITAKEQKEIFLDRHRIVKKEETKQAIEYGMQRAGKSSSDARVVDMDEPIDFGSVNSVIRATLFDGTKIVVRIHPHFVKNGYFFAESLASKKAKNLGVPAFDTYFIDDSQSKFEFDFMIMEALPGKTMQKFYLEKSFTNEEAIIKETGKYLALIHQVETKGFGFFLNKEAKEKKQLIGQYLKFQDHIFAALDEDLNFLLESKTFFEKEAENIKEIFKNNINLMNCKNPVLIHNDLADWNQMSDGKKVTGIVDWDECFSGDPVMDFAAYNLFFGEPRMSWLKKGYQEITNLPENFEEKFQLFKLRYLVSKMHLRKKRSLVEDSDLLKQNLERGMASIKEVFKYFGL